MCGICGIFDFSGAPVAPEAIQRMSDVIRHRGPDGSGALVSGEVGLGHRRLSIIDLEGGTQPISNEDDTLHVIFNGEIYNYVELTRELKALGHVFKTCSDTEVILHGYEEWGVECVNRFNGIFAFALWDSQRRRLFLARDHLGVKPLYYVRLGSRLLFASEVKALLTDPECSREVDLTSLSKLFTLRYVPSPDTLFSGIRKLPPAHCMLVDRSGVRIERYWKWRPEISKETDERVLIEKYQELLQDAVRLQMRSDVPVGLFLSSGIDSGALLALMSEVSSRPVHTFTIGFEDGRRSNETDDARELARRFGADHDEMIVGPQDYRDYYRRYMTDLEEPVGNETAAAFYFVSLLASRKVKVALTGQGADEPWAGYPRYIGIKLSRYYSRLPRTLTRSMIAPLARALSSNELIIRGVTALDEPDLLSRLVKTYSFYSEGMKHKLFQPWIREHVSANGLESRQALSALQGKVSHLDPLSQMLYIDTRANLPDDLLMVGDKTAMANSLEARVPFLDYRLVEFIETLPPSMKLRGFTAKYLHKKALAKWLPKQVVYRKKKGFANPVDRWLRERMRQYVDEMLLSDTAAVGRYFNRSYIQELITAHETGRGQYLRHIYLLLSFEMWHRQFLGAAD